MLASRSSRVSDRRQFSIFNQLTYMSFYQRHPSHPQISISKISARWYSSELVLTAPHRAHLQIRLPPKLPSCMCTVSDVQLRSYAKTYPQLMHSLLLGVLTHARFWPTLPQGCTFGSFNTEDSINFWQKKTRNNIGADTYILFILYSCASVR